MSLVIDYSNGIFEAVPSGETVGTIGGGDDNFTDVDLLLHMDGSNGSSTFTDNSNNSLTITTRNNAQLSTAEKKFGTASGLFAGGTNGTTNGDALEFNEITLTGDYTLEAWCYLDDINADCAVFGHSSSSNYQLLRFNHGGTAGRILAYAGGAYIHNPLNAMGGLSSGTWFHAAMTRESGTSRLFINGVLKDTTTTSVTVLINRVGAGYLGTWNYWDGYLDEVRITNGFARYTSNFTPPTGPFEGPGPILDLSAGNLFNHSPTGNTTYVFDNPPTTGSAYDFTLKVAPTATAAITWPSSVKWAGGTAPSAPAVGKKDVYNFFTTDGGTTYYGFQAGDDFTALPTLDGASVAGTTYSHNQSYINGLFVAPDEDKFVVTQPLPDDVLNYSMSTAGNLSTVIGVSTVVDVTATDPHMIYMGPVGQGTQTWISRNNSNELKVFTNSTAWVMNTATGTSYGLGANDAEAFWFSNDGYYLFRVSTFDLYRFPLRTAWDISTAGTAINIDMTNKVGSITAIANMWMDSTGRRAFLAPNGSSATIEEYNLTTPYDFSTAFYTGNSLSPTGGLGGFSVVGQNLYVANGTVQGDGKVRKYILGYN